MPHTRLWGALASASLVDILRAIGAVGWIYVLATSAGSLWRVFTGHSVDHDVLWARDALFAAMVLGFNIRWYVASTSGAFHLGLYVFSIIVAVQSIRAGRAYRVKHDG